MIIIIPGEPQGKARPRFAKRGNYVSTYTPEKTVAYEDHVKECFEKKILKEEDKPSYMDDEPLKVSIFAYMQIPKSASKGKAQDMRIGKTRPTKKPDADNIAKIILDALNGVAYKDDKQIIDLQVIKKYTDTPEVVVEIKEMR